MIVLDPADLTSQEGMERSFRGYFIDAKREFDGQFNTMLHTELVDCSYDDSTLTLAMEPEPWMGNPMGILHGGITASVLDLTMGLLCRYCSGGFMTPTVSMDVQYLRAAALDRRLFIRAELTKRGMGICYAVSRLWAEDREDRLIATASGAYYVTKQVRKN
ncbi:MAG: PaaI family thioesterase [Oscillospiraceae bacterium]|nr:PaaI family thioesterase [Oscillospiraceae bacterium]